MMKELVLSKNVKKDDFLHGDMTELRTLYDEAEWTRGEP